MSPQWFLVSIVISRSPKPGQSGELISHTDWRRPLLCPFLGLSFETKLHVPWNHIIQFKVRSNHVCRGTQHTVSTIPTITFVKSTGRKLPQPLIPQLPLQKAARCPDSCALALIKLSLLLIVKCGRCVKQFLQQLIHKPFSLQFYRACFDVHGWSTVNLIFPTNNTKRSWKCSNICSDFFLNSPRNTDQDKNKNNFIKWFK